MALHRHLSILPGTSTEHIKDMINGEGKSECKLCLPKFYKPAYKSKICRHLKEYHLKNGIKIVQQTSDGNGLRDVATVVPCRLSCKKAKERCHWHCPYCSKIICRTDDFMKHIKQFHTDKRILSRKEYVGVPCTEFQDEDQKISIDESLSKEEISPQYQFKDCFPQNNQIKDQCKEHFKEDQNMLNNGCPFDDFMESIGNDSTTDRLSKSGLQEKRPIESIDKDKNDMFALNSVKGREPNHGQTSQFEIMPSQEQESGNPLKRMKLAAAEGSSCNGSPSIDQMENSRLNENERFNEETFFRQQLDNRDEWITDETIQKSQEVLSRKFRNIGGLNPPAVLAVPDQIPPVEPNGKFVQIINKNQNHWLVASNVKGAKNTVQIYDSIEGYTVEEDPKVVEIIRRLVGLNTPCTVQWMRADQQRNNYDCGLHVIANATALCHGNDPTTYKWHHDHMRNHLKMCFDKREMYEFPADQSSRPGRPMKTLSLHGMHDHEP